MILASCARGPEFDSRNTPFFLFIVSFLLFIFSETEIHRPAFFIRLWMSPWLKWSIGRPTKALGRSGTFFSFVEHEWVAGAAGLHQLGSLFQNRANRRALVPYPQGIASCSRERAQKPQSPKARRIVRSWASSISHDQCFISTQTLSWRLLDSLPVLAVSLSVKSPQVTCQSDVDEEKTFDACSFPSR
jgi:hypothetical protein